MDIDTPITPSDRSGWGSHNHGAGGDGASTSDGGHGSMIMTFHTSYTDALYSAAFTPNNKGEYVGAIIFLIVLTVIYRFLTAFKSISEHRWAKRDIEKNRSVVVAGKTADREETDVGKEGSQEGSGSSGSGTDVKPVKAEKEHGWGIPWRFSTELPRALLSALIAGLGYLIMLAVMTMNVGYFLAVVGGYFLGDLIFGRFIRTGDH